MNYTKHTAHTPYFVASATDTQTFPSVPPAMRLNSLERSGLGPAFWLLGPKLECCAWHSQSVKTAMLKQPPELGQRVTVVDLVQHWASALTWDGPGPVPCFCLFSLQNVLNGSSVQTNPFLSVFLG